MTETLDEKLSRLCPEMPDDFWPEILISMTYEGKNFAFTVHRRNPDSLIDAAREALWQAAEHASADEIDKAYSDEIKRKR